MIDLDALVNKTVADQFAEAVTYDPRASSPGSQSFAARGIFDKDHEVIFEDVANSENTVAGHSTHVPMLGVRQAEIGLEPKAGDRITIRGVLYEVWDVKPDGDGWFDLILKKRL